MVVFDELQSSRAHHVLAGVLVFAGRIGLGVVGGAAGILILWLLLKKLKLTGILATQAIIATVITIAGVCDAIEDDTGLVAAIIMGVILANMRGVDVPEDRPFLKTIVQLTIGVLFISISATVTPASVRGVLWPALALVVVLVLLVRPAVAAVATVRTSLTKSERIFVGFMDPRGIRGCQSRRAGRAPPGAPTAARGRPPRLRHGAWSAPTRASVRSSMTSYARDIPRAGRRTHLADQVLTMPVAPAVSARRALVVEGDAAIAPGHPSPVREHVPGGSRLWLPGLRLAFQ